MRATGFTFIELILYVALISLFMGGVVQFYRNVLILRAKSNVDREVTHNIQFASKRLVYEIRNATAINSITSTSICLASAAGSRNPTYIYVNAGRLRIGWGGGSIDCTGLTQDQPLTSNIVDISGFNFQNLSSSLTKNIHFEFIIAHTPTNAPKEWIRSEVVSATAELRSF